MAGEGLLTTCLLSSLLFPLFFFPPISSPPPLSVNVATQLSAAPFCPGPRPSLGLSIDSLTCGFKGFFLVFCYPDYVFYFAPFYGNLEDIHPVFILPAIIFQFLKPS